MMQVTATARRRTAAVASLLVLILAGCSGGSDEDSTADGSSAAAETSTDEVGSDPTGASTTGESQAPAWWPADVPMPEGLTIESAAQDVGTGAVLDLTGTVGTADFEGAATQYQELLGGVGLTAVMGDVRDGVGVDFEAPAGGRVFVVFNEVGGATGVIATFDARSSAETETAPATEGGDRPGTAIIVVAGQQLVVEGQCLDNSFEAVTDQATVAMYMTIDAAGTYDFSGGNLTLPTGDVWAVSPVARGDASPPDIESRDAGWWLGGVAFNDGAVGSPSAPFQVEVQCS